MRYAYVFGLVLVLVLGATYLAVDGQQEAARLADLDIPVPAPTPTPIPTPAPTATPFPTPTPTPDVPQIVTVAFTGEVLSHGPIINQAALYGDSDQPYDYRPMFAQVAPLLESVDFAVCHVETPVSDDNVNLSGYPVFNAPREMPEGLAASGYDACSTASNHSLDKGPLGVDSTLAQLDSAGLQHTGMARTAEERDTATLYKVGDVTIGHLSYTYGLGNFLSNQSGACCPAASQNGIMAFLEITGTEADGYEVSGLSFVPTRVDRTDYTIVPLPQAVQQDDLDDGVRALYQDVIDETAEVVRSLGVDVRIRDTAPSG